MKDEIWRCRLDAYPLRVRLQTRFGDMDVNAHLNNVAIARLFEETRLRLHHEIIRRGGKTEAGGTLIVHIAIDYLGEGRYPDDVEAAVGVRAMGRSSYRIAHGLFQNGRAFAIAESVMVCVQPGEKRPGPIPDRLRDCFAELMVNELTEG